ncbi:MAG: hypothetical protein QG661_2954 [Actinomycetota bacterium]|jgi:hypothetical protein|nr:hypothetical protein [Actinomycetota bacterium]MDQ5975745.1 hypothetical protein [Actinomycetota bacterium]
MAGTHIQHPNGKMGGSIGDGRDRVPAPQPVGTALPEVTSADVPSLTGALEHLAPVPVTGVTDAHVLASARASFTAATADLERVIAQRAGTPLPAAPGQDTDTNAVLGRILAGNPPIQARIDYTSIEQANSTRATWAAEALAAYAARTGDGAEDLDTAVGDLLSDLLHLAHQHGGRDIDDLLDQARRRWAEEQTEF